MVTRFKRLSRAEKRPGSLLFGPGIPDNRRAGLSTGGGASLTEATSNLNVGGAVCARRVTRSSKPMAVGAATANSPAATKSAFMPPFRFLPILSLSIASILIFSAAPLRGLSENNGALRRPKNAATGDYSPHDMALLTQGRS